MSDELKMFRVPVVVFTVTPGTDERDAAQRAEAVVADSLRVVRGPRAGATVVGVQELNVALRGAEFIVEVNGMSPTFRGKR